MQLFHREFGDPFRPTLVIIHGLLGSSRNWQIPARKLADRYHVVLPDLRNHGESFHADTSTFAEQADDMLRFFDAFGLDAPQVVGHSMGGKVAMRLACTHPDRIGRLAIVDIAPRDYGAGSVEIDAMAKVDLSSVGSRGDAAAQLAEWIPDETSRLFLVTNLGRDDEGGFGWRINLDGLVAALPDLRASPLESGERYDADTLFLLGSKSDFVSRDDHALIRRHFPAADIRVIDGSGHNPHVEKPDEFLRLLTEFLDR